MYLIYEKDTLGRTIFEIVFKIQEAFMQKMELLTF